MYFQLEQAPKKTPCRRCREPIAKEAWMTSAWIYADTNGNTKTVYYHPRCAVDVDARALHGEFIKYEKGEFAEHLDAVEQFAAARAAAFEAYALDPRSPRARIEPATDPRGRPRVRVRFGGSMSGGSKFMEVFEKHCPDWTFASSLREYVLAPHAVSSGVSSDDPSQPVVGAVFGTPCSVKLVGSQREKVQNWRTEGLRVPVLWIYDDEKRGQATIDGKVLELRAMLEAAGYEADEAPVVVSRIIDAAAFAALARALDEHMPASDTRAALIERSPVDRATELLEAAIEEDRAEAWPAAIERCARALLDASEAQRERLVVLARGCVDDNDCKRPLLQLVIASKVASDDASFIATTILQRELEAEARTLGGDYALCVAIVDRCSSSAKLAACAPIERALLAEKSATTRLTALGSQLASWGDEATAQRLEAWTKSAKAPKAVREAVAALAKELCATLARKAAAGAKPKAKPKARR
ncbi:MAG: hypothetical protein Q8Q09_28350 [Deltaproteobacteria bacterium]|nr:hypothetical protein [Deltaproteobacteria bacterium]